MLIAREREKEQCNTSAELLEESLKTERGYMCQYTHRENCEIRLSRVSHSLTTFKKSGNIHANTYTERVLQYVKKAS